MLIRWRIFIFLIAGLVCYSNIFNAPFIFDDLLGIIENRGIRSLWPLWNIMDVLPDETPWGRPMVQLSLALNYAISGLNVWSYHLLNIIIHVSNALILCELLRILLKKYFPSSSDTLSLIIALLWLVHPLPSAAVTYTVQRAESLMALFYLLTLYFTIRVVLSSEQSPKNSAQRNLFFQIAGIASAFLGICSKEAFLTAPLAALFLDAFVLQTPWKKIFQKRRNYYIGLFSTWILLAFLMLKWPRSDSVGVSEKLSSLDYFLIQWQVIIHYLRLTILPIGLSLDYDWPKVKNILDALPHGVFLATLFSASVYALWKKRLWGYPVFFLFLVLSPTSSFIPVYTSVAIEHRMYLPLMALMTLAVIAVFFFTEKFPKHRLNLRLFTFIAVFLVFSTLTFLRNLDYQSGISIWQNVVQKQPFNKRAWNNLGGMYYQSGDVQTALECFKRSVDIDPLYAEALSNVGVVTGQMGNLSEGIVWLEKAATIKPKSIQTCVNLGLFYFDAGNLERSADNYQRVLKINPHHAQAATNLALIYFRQKHYQEGLSLVNNVLEFAPDYPSASQLKAALLQSIQEESSKRKL